MHDLPLLTTIGVALCVALIGGLAARRLGLPPIVGYLLAGVTIGPFTPGFVGDVESISQLTELGVVFLMLGVGLHFSLKDLWQVRDIAIPGALGQTAIATLVVAILRDGHLAANPKSQTVLTGGDRLGFIGQAEQITAAEALLATAEEGPSPISPSAEAPSPGNAQS